MCNQEARAQHQHGILLDPVTTRLVGQIQGLQLAYGGDRTPTQSGEMVLEDEDEPKEWMAHVEHGVQITFVSLPNGGNDFKRI